MKEILLTEKEIVFLQLLYFYARTEQNNDHSRKIHKIQFLSSFSL